MPSPLFLHLNMSSRSPVGTTGVPKHPAPIPEDAPSRVTRWLAVEQQDKKKDEEKKWVREKRVARNALEKHNRAQEREGLPLEASPNTNGDNDDDDDEEGMEVRLGFSLEVRLWSETTSIGPSVGVDVPVLGLEASGL
jgi:hypothetical protein